MAWQVTIKRRVVKDLEKFPESIRELTAALKADIEQNGPLRFNWKNFCKFEGYDYRYHCHIKKGRPTYVACWEIQDKKICIVEIYYVGTHEKAPY